MRTSKGLRAAVMLADALAMFWLGGLEPDESVIETGLQLAHDEGCTPLEAEILSAAALLSAYRVRVRRAQTLLEHGEALAAEGLERPVAIDLTPGLLAPPQADPRLADRWLRRPRCCTAALVEPHPGGGAMLCRNPRRGASFPMARYEIRIAHELNDTLRDAFVGLSPVAEGGVTRVRGDLDQAGLHGVLERLRILGYDLIDVRRLRGPAPRR